MLYFVIVAGGTGSRMESSIPKQYLPILGQPMLRYAIAQFAAYTTDATIIIVAHKDYFSDVQQCCASITAKIEIVEGGATRFESVKNGIHAIKDANANDIVLVHDAARPNIDKELIDRLVQNISMNQITIPVWPINDSIRKKTAEHDSIVIDRKDLYAVQTPQAAYYQDILQAFQQEYQESFTDEATVMERDFCSVKLVDGKAENIKVTTPEQIALMEFFLKGKELL